MGSYSGMLRILPLPLTIHFTPFSTCSLPQKVNLEGQPLPSFLVLWVLVGLGPWEALTGDQKVRERGQGIYGHSSCPVAFLYGQPTRWVQQLLPGPCGDSVLPLFQSQHVSIFRCFLLVLPVPF